MSSIKVDLLNKTGIIKPMHAVNNGPIHKENDQGKSNLKAFADAGIPYARNHDASFCTSYGGNHTVDVNFIFKDFDADPYDENSYDFLETDNYTETIMKTGTEVFYRLGSRIEHGLRKDGTAVPKDFNKWAVICEHIIRHMNEGWANGHHYGIKYWEIWNEADLDRDGSTNKRTWQGTAKQYYEMYRITALHLKKCFPKLCIGGPAVCNLNGDEWINNFFAEMTKEPRVPIDFFSWHIYAKDPEFVVECCAKARGILDRYGYTETQSILNEWNYVHGWEHPAFTESIQHIIGIKGAAFTASTMCMSQDSPVDMLMYYDARPSVFNGLFDFYTLRPLKGYYPFLYFNKLYRMGTQVKVSGCPEKIAAVAASDKANNMSMLISYYDFSETDCDKSLVLDFENAGFDTVKVVLVDKDKTNEVIGEKTLCDGKITLDMTPNSFVLIESK